MKYIAMLKPDNDEILKGNNCITTLKALYECIVYPECTELEITKEFADTYFTYRGLVDFVMSIATMFPSIDVTVDDVMFRDLDDATKTIMRYRTPDEFIFALEQNPTRVMQTIRELCKYYFETQEDSSIASNKLATLLMQVGDLQNECNAKEERILKVESEANEALAKLHSLVSRVNFHYEKTVNEDALFHLQENQFIKILYIKEISRVNYTDTLIYYLREIVKTMYGEPIRCTVIEPFYAYKRVELYPGYIPHWKLTYKDVFMENIYMAGFQPKVMRDILQNPNHIHYLIVLDRSGCNAPFITGLNVDVVYTVSDNKDAMSIDNRRLISYSEDTLNIPYIDGFNDLSKEEKIQKYSTMPIMHTLLEMLERRK